VNVLTIPQARDTAGKLAGKILNVLGMDWVGTSQVLCPFPCNVLAMYRPSTLALAPSASSGTMLSVTPKVGDKLPLFGDDQLARARQLRLARDAQRELDPRAELKLYLDEPLYEGSMSPMRWWKVSSYLHP